MATKTVRRGGKKEGSGVGVVVFWLSTRIVLPLLAVYALLWWRADAAVDRQLAHLRPFLDIQRGTTVLGLDGDIGFRKLVVRPRTGSPLPAIGITADRVTLQTPGLFWLVRSSLFGVPDEIPSRFGIRLEKAEIQGDSAALRSMLVGSHVFFPFDLAGCEPGMSLNAASELGLRAANSDFSVLMTRAGDGAITLRFDSRTTGIATIEGELQFSATRGGNASLQLAGAAFRNARFTLVDQGYVAKRNTYCAGKLGLDAAGFVPVHLAAVKSGFARDGVIPGVAMTKAYTGFVTDGGRLTITARPLRPAPFAQIGAIELDRLGLYFDATIKHGDDFTAPITFLPVGQYEGVVATAPEPVPVVDSPAAPVPAVPDASTTALKPGDVIPYDRLPDYVGARVAVETKLSVRQGTLTGASSISVVVRLDAQEGGFPMSLPSNTVVQVRLIEAAPGSAQ